jgi:hypothetical protein
MTVNKRLVRPPRRFDPKLLPDLLVIFMANIEEALVVSGATPTADYNRLDLLQAAMPLAEIMFNDTNSKPMEIITEWPELQHDDQRG